MKKAIIAVIINLLLLNIVLAQDVWQYKVYQFSDSRQSNFIEEAIKRLEYRLNSFGLEGWELIKAPDGKNLKDGIYVFKKRVDPLDAQKTIDQHDLKKDKKEAFWKLLKQKLGTMQYNILANSGFYDDLYEELTELHGYNDEALLNFIDSYAAGIGELCDSDWECGKEQDKQFVEEIPIETPCLVGVPLKDGLVYLPNGNKPFTGKTLCKHENGQKKMEVYFKDGKANGEYTSWHENGQKSIEGNLKDDKFDGMRTGWYENGQKAFEGNYKDDQRDGNWTWWYENGQKKIEGNYINDKPEGKVTFWNEDGTIEKVEYYENGELVN